MLAILALREELAALHVPLVVIEYDQCAPRSAQDAHKTDSGVIAAKGQVTPQHAPAVHIHPIAQIVIALCAAPTINTTTTPVSSETNSMHTVSAHKSALSSPHTHVQLTSRATALISDDCLHPLDLHVLRAVAAALPSLPVLSIDSDSLYMIRREPEMSQFGGRSAPPNTLTFDSYCEKVEQSLPHCHADWPTVTALKVLFCTVVFPMKCV